MRSTGGVPGKDLVGDEPFEQEARRNPASERVAAGGDNIPRADQQAELQDDLAKKEHPAFLEALAKGLKAPSRAEAKIREGTHGLCDACGGMIPAARLQVVPGATRCVPCAGRAERRQAVERKGPWVGEYQLPAA